MAAPGHVRSLGLAIQLIAGYALGGALVPIARAILMAPGDMGGEIVRYQAPIAALVLVQLAAGCVIAYGSAGWARAAALSYAIAALSYAIFAVATLGWNPLEHEPPASMIGAQAIGLVWPVAVAIAVWRAPAAPRRERAETGGPLVAIGLTAIFATLLHAYEWIAFSAERSLGAWGGKSLYVAAQLLIGLLALRAGRRVTAGAAGAAVGAYLAVAIVIGIGLLVLNAIFLASMGEPPPQVAWWILVGALSIAISLAVPVLLWAYARRGAIVHPGAPDSAAAARALAWLALYFGIQLVGSILGVLGREEPLRPLEWVGLGMIAGLAALDVAAFVSHRRGAADRTMWSSAIGGVLAIVAFSTTLAAYDQEARWQVQGEIGWALAAQASTLLVLAWLHRPSARDQRGVEAVFD